MSTETSTYCLPEDILKKLLCSCCSSYVSCGPVKVRPDGSTICGRCSSLTTEDCVRQLLFETVMSKFTFPCRYKAQGCKKQLLFGSIEHEDACPYRSFPCPSLSSKGCKTSVCALDVLKHFKENHNDLILTEGKFKISLDRDSQCNYLMNKEGLFVTVQYIYDSVKQELYLDVAKFSEQAISYKLQIINGSNCDHSFSIKNYPCYRYDCHTISQRLARNFSMGNYLPALDNPDFILMNILLQNNCDATNSTDKSCSVEGKESSSLNVKEITDLKLCKTSSNKDEEKATAAWASLENFRCRYCLNLVFPPVYYTDRYKYYVCYECIGNDEYADEKIVGVVTYPCRWRGCTFEGNQSNIQKHITEDCEFRAYICPLSHYCETGNFTSANLISHLQTHGTYCANPEKIIIDLYSNSNNTFSKFYFAVYQDQIISIKCTIKEKHEWCLTFDLQNLDIEMFFEHNHCRFKSKTYTRSACSNVTFEDVPSKYYFPSCFNACKNITGFLKITSIAVKEEAEKKETKKNLQIENYLLEMHRLFPQPRHT